MTAGTIRGRVRRRGGNGLTAWCARCETLVPPVVSPGGVWTCPNHDGEGRAPATGERWTRTKRHVLVQRDGEYAFCRACREAVVWQARGPGDVRCGGSPWAPSPDVGRRQGAVLAEEAASRGVQVPPATFAPPNRPGRGSSDLCECAGCGQTFAGLTVFDAHLDGVDRPTCREPSELGMSLDGNGVWRGARSPAAPRRRRQGGPRPAEQVA